MYTYIKSIENILYKKHKCKIYYIYRITNFINGKIYIGKHIQNNYKIDKYLGSGNLIKAAVKKYGNVNFKKEILSYHSNEADLSKAESLAITESMVLDPMYYNLKPGGTGFSHGNYNPNKNCTYIINEKNEIIKIHVDEYDPSVHKHAIMNDNNGMYNKVIVKNDNGDKLIVDKNNIPDGYKFHLSAYKRSDEYKQKMSIACSGEKNGMYGKKQSDKMKEMVRKKVYIEGTIYNSRKEAAELLNIKNANLITKRCNSKSKKFKEWYYL